MNKIKIYHNPNCSKSRKALKLIQEKKIEIEIIEYLKYPITIKELKFILKVLKLKPYNVVRKNEKVWKDNYSRIELTENEIIKLIIKNPIILKRPIIINNNLGVIARPAERVQEIFN